MSLQFLKGSRRKGILFKKEGYIVLKTYTDADCVDSLEDRRSSSRYCTF